MTRPRLKTQDTVLIAIRDLTALHSMPPTVDELRQRLGVRSTRTVLRYLRDLETAGLIQRWSGARGIRIKGWEFYHEHDAALIRRDGFMCEQHPGLEFEHDPNCGGPGQAWVIEGKARILAALKIQRTNAGASPGATDQG